MIVTLVVLYSYCNGNSVCYTFPLFSGLERDRLVKPEVVVTSVIVQTKRPFDMGEISGKPKGIVLLKRMKTVILKASRTCKKRQGTGLLKIPVLMMIP